MIKKNQKIGWILLLVGAILVAAQYTGIIPALGKENDKFAIFLLGLGLIIVGIRYTSLAIGQPVKIKMAHAGIETAPSFLMVLKKFFSDKGLVKNVLASVFIAVYILAIIFGGLLGTANIPGLKELAMVGLGHFFSQTT